MIVIPAEPSGPRAARLDDRLREGAGIHIPGANVKAAQGLWIPAPAFGRPRNDTADQLPFRKSRRGRPRLPRWLARLPL